MRRTRLRTLTQHLFLVSKIHLIKPAFIYDLFFCWGNFQHLNKKNEIFLNFYFLTVFYLLKIYTDILFTAIVFVLRNENTLVKVPLQLCYLH